RTRKASSGQSQKRLKPTEFTSSARERGASRWRTSSSALWRRRNRKAKPRQRIENETYNCANPQGADPDRSGLADARPGARSSHVPVDLARIGDLADAHRASDHRAGL